MAVLWVLCAFYVLQITVAYDVQHYEGSQLITATPDDDNQVQILDELQYLIELDFWEDPTIPGQSVSIFTESDDIEFLKGFLSGSEISFSVDDYDVTSELKDEWQRLSQRDSMNFNYTDFNDYQTTMDELDLMAAECPAGFNCLVDTLGQTAEGRDIRMLSMLSTTPGRPAVWIDSNIHAREWLSSATTMNIFRRMIDGAGQGGDADSLLEYNWYFVPVMNPDGYHHTWTDARLWRKNRTVNNNSTCNGTDLNRNYDYNWGDHGASAVPCSYTYRGPSAASELETQAIQNQVLSIMGELAAFWTVHTYGQYLLAPLGDCTTPPPAEWEVLSTVTNATCDSIEATYDTIWECGNTCEILYRTSGTTSDWAYGVAGVLYSWTPELRGNFGGFVTPPSEIPFSVEEIWNGLVTMVSMI